MSDNIKFEEEVALLFDTKSGVTKEEAFGLPDCSALDKAFILAYSPSVCAFAKWNGSNFTEFDGAEIPDIYEFRCFGADFELRWVRDRTGDKGTSVFLKEGPGNGAKKYLPLNGKYLLWGKKRGGTEQYDELYEYRIGSLKIPRLENLLNDGCVALKYREYFEEGEYGNIFFFAERLVAIQCQ